MEIGGMINFAANTLSAKTVRIIEDNTQKQVNHKEGYKEITWSNGVPARVEVWEDASKAIKLWTRDYTFTGGVPTGITIVNEDDGITVTKQIVWQNGLPVSVNKI